MKLIDLFNGEQRGDRSVVSRDDLHLAHETLAFGRGWGQRLVGTADELRSVGAYPIETGEIESTFLVLLDNGIYLDCEVLAV